MRYIFIHTPHTNEPGVKFIRKNAEMFKIDIPVEVKEVKIDVLIDFSIKLIVRLAFGFYIKISTTL